MRPELINPMIFTQNRLLVKLCNEYYLIDSDMSRMAKDLPADTLVFCLGETHMNSPKECIRKSSTNDHCYDCQPLIASSALIYDLPRLNKDDISNFVNPIVYAFTLDEMEKEIKQAFIHGQGNAQSMEAGLERDETEDYLSSRMRSLSKEKSGLFVFNATVEIGAASFLKLKNGYVNILSIHKA